MRFRLSPKQGSDISATELEPSASLGCCTGPKFHAVKVPPLSPASSCSVRSGTHCFSGHRVFDDTARHTAEKSNVSLVCVASSTVSGMFDSGYPPHERVRLAASGFGDVASLAGATQSADGRADGGFSGALMVRATLAGAAHSAGACFAQACGGEHSSVRARFLRACGGGHSAVRAGCGAGVTACRLGGSVPEASGA